MSEERESRQETDAMVRAVAVQRFRERLERSAEEVRQMVRDTDHWNRIHPDQPPLTVDDEAGHLAAALKLVGLDLEQLTREARGQ